ncbi:MAG: hypothetical protein N2316_01765 [Spirochaetes bacterium]|nr:hypothetical protein [Spirochaetota bacterium]
MRNDKKKMQQEVLCALARQNCIAMLETRGLFDNLTVASFCEFISTLCEKLDDPICKEQSSTCRRAAQAIKYGEMEDFLKLCTHACKTCPYPQRRTVEDNNLIQ